MNHQALSWCSKGHPNQPLDLRTGRPMHPPFDLTGLELGQTYTVTAVSRDLALNTWSSDALEIVPVELPDVVITETHANALEEGGIGEFVEIYNYGETDLDLSGWALVRSGTETRADLPENTVVPARSVAVLVDETFNNAPYPSLSPSAIIEIGLFSLVNSNLYLDLIDLGSEPSTQRLSWIRTSMVGVWFGTEWIRTHSAMVPPTPGEWQANSCAGQ